MIDPRLTGRVALVTGANQGIGAATAVSLAACGVAVLLAYKRLDPAEHGGDPAFPEAYGRLRARDAQEVVTRIRREGGRAEHVEADLAGADTVGGLFDRAEAAFGPVEILVNVRRGATWGRIIGLTSGGPAGFPEEVSYGAAKAAQENYTMSAAAELGRYGITANMLRPPATDTGWVTPAVEKAVRTAGPLRHVGTPEEVAEVIVFLASHQARHVTGQVISMS